MTAQPTTEPAPIWTVGSKACLKGGEVAGQYLDAIGLTDLAQMNAGQWELFCMKLVGGALLAAIGDIHGDQVPF